MFFGGHYLQTTRNHRHSGACRNPEQTVIPNCRTTRKNDKAKRPIEKQKSLDSGVRRNDVQGRTPRIPAFPSHHNRNEHLGAAYGVVKKIHGRSVLNFTPPLRGSRRAKGESPQAIRWGDKPRNKLPPPIQPSHKTLGFIVWLSPREARPSRGE